MPHMTAFHGDETKKIKMADHKKLSFSTPPILNIFFAENSGIGPWTSRSIFNWNEKYSWTKMNLKRISILLFYAARIQACYLMDICIEHLPLVNEYVKNEQYLLKCTKLLKRKIEFIQNLLTVTRTWCSVIVTFSVCLTKIKLFWKGSC